MLNRRQRASIRHAGKCFPLAHGKRFTVKENQSFSLEGLDPYSPVEVRLEGDETFRILLHADMSGVVEQERKNGDSVPQRLRIAMRGGEAFEIRCHSEGISIEFIVEMEYNRLTAEEIRIMLADISAMDLQWDATSPIPTRVGDLEQRVTRLMANHPALASMARSIFARPDEMLQRSQRLVPSNSVRRLGATDIRTNLVQRRLDLHGNPLTNEIMGAVDVATVDTPANAYVSMIIKSLSLYRDELIRQVVLEAKRIAAEEQRERTYRRPSAPAGTTELTAGQLLERLKQLLSALNSIDLAILPRDWKGFRSSPDPTANAVRFDARFIKLTRLTAEIMNQRVEAARIGRLQRIAEFGRRPHNEIYEIWTVSKTFEALYRLGFRTPRVTESDNHLEAFLELENPAGTPYGLRKNRPVALAHKDAEHLFVMIGYEPEILHGGHSLTPDIMVVLRGSSDINSKAPASFRGLAYGRSPLYLDAKFQMKSLLDPTGNKSYITKYVELASADGKRRPHSYILQAAPSEFAWAQRKRKGEEDSARRLGLANDTLFPYRVGVANLVPNLSAEDTSLEARLPLVRIVYAWLVTQGVIAICPRCGSALSKRADNNAARSTARSTTSAHNEPFKPYLPLSGSEIPMPSTHTLECRHCELGVTANYCGSCRKNGVFVPIIKLYPRSDSEDERQTPEWIRDYEIAEPSEARGLRHCPRCGDK